MKYRFLKTKAKDYPWKLIKDPDGENKTIGKYKSISGAQSKHRSILKGEQYATCKHSFDFYRRR